MTAPRTFLLVGLTGGIATGKSTVSAMLRSLGCIVIDADQLARDVVEPGAPALATIAAEFGRDVIQADGTLDRKRLGAIVFADSGRRKRLEAITHPAIRERFMRRVQQLADERFRGVVVFDAAVMIESGNYKNMDRLLVVATDEATEIARLMARDDIGRDEAALKVRSQMPVAEKATLADYVIDNGGDRGATEAQVRRVHEVLAAERQLSERLAGCVVPIAALFPVGMGVYRQNRVDVAQVFQRLRTMANGLDVLGYHWRPSGNFLLRDPGGDAMEAAARAGERVINLRCIVRRFPELVRIEWASSLRQDISLTDDGDARVLVVAVMLAEDVPAAVRAHGRIRTRVEVVRWVSGRDVLCLYQRPKRGGSIGHVTATVLATTSPSRGTRQAATGRTIGVIRDVLAGVLHTDHPAVRNEP